MDSDDTRDAELVARLRRLEAGAGSATPGFNYDGMLERHAAGIQRARRRLVLARGAAVGLVVALIGASFWRLETHEPASPTVASVTPPVATQESQPRIVRADTWLAVAALEDHIATVDDALNYARLTGGTADVERLERTRAELIDSYRQVRYAELVSANF
jgi:hypothetical protein